MNKTNYLILILILCFSIAFIVCPIKTNALSEDGQAMIDALKEKYDKEEEKPGGLVIITNINSPLTYEGPPDPQGDLVFGASTNFNLEEANLGNLGPNEPVVLLVTPPTGGGTTTGGREDKEWNCYVCSGPNCVIQTFTKKCNHKCKPSTTPPDCHTEGTPPTTPKYSCNTSTWTCSTDSAGAYTSLATCQANCVATPIPGGCPSGQTNPHRECR